MGRRWWGFWRRVSPPAKGLNGGRFVPTPFLTPKALSWGLLVFVLLLLPP